MSHPLIDYAVARIPVERARLYLDCHQLLEDYYPDGWFTVLDQMLLKIEDQETEDNITMVHQAFINNMQAMVRECNLDFNENVDFNTELPQLYEITRAVYTLDQYPNMVALQARFDSRSDAAEQVASVLHEVRPKLDPDAFYCLVNHISSTFITRLREVLESTIEQIAPMLESQPQVTVIQSALGQYGKDYPDLLQIPFSHVGGTLDSYVDRYRTQLETMNPPTAVRLLLLCALMAKLDEATGRPALANVIQSIFQHDVRRAITCGRLLLAMEYPRADA